ncbi:MAG: hypothetical protein NVSMB5_26390 [Candidatus Velthaea sp.]
MPRWVLRRRIINYAVVALQVAAIAFWVDAGVRDRSPAAFLLVAYLAFNAGFLLFLQFKMEATVREITRLQRLGNMTEVLLAQLLPPLPPEPTRPWKN